MRTKLLQRNLTSVFAHSITQLVWEVKNHAYLDANTRERWSTVRHLFVAPIKITKMYKRERIHFISGPCGEHSCVEFITREKQTQAAILHISERCVPYSNARCVSSRLFDILFLSWFIFNRVVLFNPLYQRGQRLNQSKL